jgi:PAS domain S-box-containing protein
MLVLTLLLGAGWVSYRSLHQLAADEGWVNHTHEVLNRLGRSLSLLQDAETGQRGYLLTADPSFQAPLQQARRQIGANEQALARLMADNPAQIRRLDTLRQLTAVRFSYLDQGLAYFNQTRQVNVPLLRQGKAVMDKARAVQRRLAAAEQRLLARRRAQSRYSSQRALALIGGLTALALVLVGLASSLLHRTRQARAREVEEGQAQFRQLLESIPNMAWTAQPDGSISYYNEQWYSYTGLTFADLGGVNWQHHIHPDDFATTLAAWQHSLSTGEPLSALRNRWKRAADGQYRWHLVRAVPLYDEATGAIRLWVGTNTDIHAQQLQQQALERANADLNTFVYTASHDLKTPIHNIEALLTELQEGLGQFPLPTEAAPLLGMMQVSVDRFKVTLTHLTDVAKLQQVTGEGPADEVDLAALVEDIRYDLRPLLAATGGHLHLDVMACPRLVFPEANLRSIVYNLLSNALKYHHPDRVPEVWLRTYPAATDGSRPAVLEVQDNGLGLVLGPEQKRKLFGLFERLHDHVEGSGMGLFTVKKIVENAGGHIEVESQLGQGTLFRLHLPSPPAARHEAA